ncbi:MAG: preprotein translocase subunit YajC [Oligoflexia bacterium]|nr:preprotein translocase subunit YajC [Oligoflexia bacterium]
MHRFSASIQQQQLQHSSRRSRIRDIATFLLSSFAFNGSVLAQTGAAASPSPLTSLIPFAVIFLVFYFLLIRPQKKKAQQEEAMLAALTKGDEIFTRAGIIGTIIGLTDKIATIEVADGVRIKILRGQIGGHAKKVLEPEVVEKGKK